MRQTGIVEEVRGNTATVKIIRSSACGENCASCGLCQNKEMLAEAKNTANAAAGDTVIIETADNRVMGAAFLAYILPLIAMLAGYFLGAVKSETAGIIASFIFLAAAFAAVILTDKKRRQKYLPQIIGKAGEEITPHRG